MSKLRALLAGAAILGVAALPQAAQARVFVGVGFGFGPAFYPAPYYYGPPAYYAPPPVYYVPPPAYYAPPPAYYPPTVPAASYAPSLSTTCRTVRASCPMDRPGVVGAGCTCPGPNGAAQSGTIR